MTPEAARRAASRAGARARARRGEGDRLRDEILAVTERLLVETNDAGAVSIRAIADAAGVSAPAIYMHFPDKTHLLYQVCTDQFAELDAAVEAATAGLDDPIARLEAQGRAYVRFGVENPEQYRLLFMTPGTIPPDADPEEVLSLSCFPRVVDAARAAIDAGLFRPDLTDPFAVATALWASVHGITSLLIAKPEFPWPEADLFDLVCATQLRGMLRS